MDKQENRLHDVYISTHAPCIHPFLETLEKIDKRTYYVNRLASIALLIDMKLVKREKEKNVHYLEKISDFKGWDKNYLIARIGLNTISTERISRTL